MSGRRAAIRYAQKNSIYSIRANQLGSGFLPFVLESTGFIYANSDKLLQDLAAAEEVKMIPKATLYMYFLKRISVCLQKNIAKAINQRIFDILSHTTFTTDPTFHYHMVVGS